MIGKLLEGVCRSGIFSLADSNDQVIQKPFVAAQSRTTEFLDKSPRQMPQFFRAQGLDNGRKFGRIATVRFLVIIGNVQKSAYFAQQFGFLAGFRQKTAGTALRGGLTVVI